MLLFLSFKRKVHRRQVPGPEKREAKKCYPLALPLDPGGCEKLVWHTSSLQTLWSQLHEAAGEGAAQCSLQRHASHPPAPVHSASSSPKPFCSLSSEPGWGDLGPCPGHCYLAPDQTIGALKQGFCALIPPWPPQGPDQAQTGVLVGLLIGQLDWGPTSQTRAGELLEFQKDFQKSAVWDSDCTPL